MLEHEADAAVAGRRTSVTSSPEISTRPLSGVSRPAITRSSVDLPQPEGPSSAVSEPPGISRLDVVERDEVAEALVDVSDRDGHRAPPFG